MSDTDIETLWDIEDAAREVMGCWERGDIDNDYDRWAGAFDALGEALAGIPAQRRAEMEESK